MATMHAAPGSALIGELLPARRHSSSAWSCYRRKSWIWSSASFNRARSGVYSRGNSLGPVAKFFRAGFVRGLRSVKPAFAQSQVEIRSSKIPISNHKLGRITLS